MNPNHVLIWFLLFAGATCVACGAFMVGPKAGLLGSGLVCLSIAYRWMQHTRR